MRVEVVSTAEDTMYVMAADAPANKTSRKTTTISNEPCWFHLFCVGFTFIALAPFHLLNCDRLFDPQLFRLTNIDFGLFVIYAYCDNIATSEILRWCAVYRCFIAAILNASADITRNPIQFIVVLGSL